MKTEHNVVNDEDYIKILVMTLGNQKFGVSVTNIRDVLTLKNYTTVPLAAKEVIGLVNLRGRIVTAIDAKQMLGIENDKCDKKVRGEGSKEKKENDDTESMMSVVVEYKNELYSITVDSTGDVLNIPHAEIKHNPENLSQNWLDVSLGIVPLEDDLLVIVDINKLLQSLYKNGEES